MRCRLKHPRSLSWIKNGVTLTELLIVTVIMLTVTAMTVAKISPAISARRTREAARMFSTMLNSARNRALEIGRPAGVWIERMADLPEAAMTVAYAQVPEPYNGDFADSRVECFIYPDYDTTNLQYYINVVKPVSGGVRDRDLWYSPNPLIQQVVRPNDELTVNCSRVRWGLDTSNNTRLAGDFSTPVWVVSIGANATDFWSAQNGKFSNEIQDNGRYVIRWFRKRGTYLHALRTPGSRNPLSSQQEGSPVAYNIHRQPVRSSSGAIELPEGSVIDLNYSGDANWPMYVRYNAADADTRGNRGNPFTGTAEAPEVANINRQPIIIVFDENGSVSQVNGPSWDSTMRVWSYRPYDPPTTMFFLIGHRECVPANWDITTAAQLENNWLSVDAIWVTIQTDNGQIITSDNRPMARIDTATGQVTSPTATANGLTYLNMRSLWGTVRDLARRRVTLGGG